MGRRNQIMDLKNFLVKAKINTYASAGEGGEKVLEDGEVSQRRNFSFEHVHNGKDVRGVFLEPLKAGKRFRIILDHRGKK